MAQAQMTTYTMEAFVDDVREVFKTERDPHKQAKAVAGYMKELLAVPGWLEELRACLRKADTAGTTYIWTKSLVTQATAGTSWRRCRSPDRTISPTTV